MGRFYGPFESFSLLILYYTVEDGLSVFLETDRRAGADNESTYASLRAALKTLQVCMSAETREAVLGYISHMAFLNAKQTGMQVNTAIHVYQY